MFSRSRGIKPTKGCSLEENAVDDAVLTRSGRDFDVAFTGFDDCTLDEDVSSNVVWIGFILDDVDDVSVDRLTGLWIVDRDLVGSHDTNHGVATGFAVDLASRFANESELLLG